MAMGNEGWGCEPVDSKDSCKGDKCNEVILIALIADLDPMNSDGKGNRRDPWNDPNFRWKTGVDNSVLTDIHAIRYDDKLGGFKQIPEYSDSPQQFDQKINWQLFGKENKKLCCRRAKDNLRGGGK